MFQCSTQGIVVIYWSPIPISSLQKSTVYQHRDCIYAPFLYVPSIHWWSENRASISSSSKLFYNRSTYLHYNNQSYNMSVRCQSYFALKHRRSRRRRYSLRQRLRSSHGSWSTWSALPTCYRTGKGLNSTPSRISTWKRRRNLSLMKTLFSRL